MRKGTGSLQISPRRLLSLLLLHIIAALAVQQVNGSRSSSQPAPASNVKSISLNDGVSYVKKHMMLSRCSSRYVQIKPGKKINAKGNWRSPYAVLKFESDPRGVRIQGDTSNTYLCFSKKGRLIARHDGDRNSRCVFQEVYQSGTSYVKLQSVDNGLWYVGFSPRGRKLFGYEYKYPRNKKFRRRRFQNCFLFTKTSGNSRHSRRRRTRTRRHFNERDLAVLRRRTSRSRNR